MSHDTPLIATIAAGLGFAFVFGLIAVRLRLPPIVGYLFAGIVVGPFTPGFVADPDLAAELAEIGVILLMFGVGLHFSVKDLMSVRGIALPGAVVQIAASTLFGIALAFTLGWTFGAGLLFGLALSVASTVVLLRALQEHGLIETERGRIAVGWLIVEDLVMVSVLVLVPPLAGLLGGDSTVETTAADVASLTGSSSLWMTLGITLAKVVVFLGIMLVAGRRLIPALLHLAAHSGSRELFRLAVLAVALGVAYSSSKLFGVSFALGAFFAGMVLAESPLSTQAARETLPLRDAFAVLFFVSVGMLFDPAILTENPLSVLATFFIIVIGKSVAAYAIVRTFGYPQQVALTISASLAQIGEFSFILVVLGVDLAILPPEARDLVVGGALLSIITNPLLFFLLESRFGVSKPGTAKATPLPEAEKVQPDAPPVPKPGHVAIVGGGRVGTLVAERLIALNMPFLVAEEDAGRAEVLRSRGVDVLTGVGGEGPTLDWLGLASARWLVTAIPDPHEAGHIIESAKQTNPGIKVIARAHDQAAVAYLRERGADHVILAEEETARGMIAEILSKA